MPYEHQRHYDLADVFKNVLHQIDPGFTQIDTVAFLERMEIPFQAFENLIRPRHYTLKPKDTKITQEVFAFPRGLSDAGTMGYRIVIIDPKKALRIFDIDQLSDDTRLSDTKATPIVRKRQFEAIARLTDPRLQQTLNARYKAIARQVPGGVTDIDSFGFMEDGDCHAYKDMRSTYDFFAREMTQQLEDLIDYDNAVRTHIFREIKEALQAYAVSQLDTEAALLKEAHGLLDTEVSGLLALNPSSRTITNYDWVLYPDEKKRFEDDDGKFSVGRFRRAIVRACPIITLIDDYQKLDGDYAGAMTIDPKDGGMDIDPDKLIKNLFEAEGKSRVKFYQRLREEHIGAHLARHLFSLGGYLEFGRPHVPLPTNQQDWERIAQMWTISSRLGKTLQRYHGAVFAEIVASSEGYKAATDDVLYRHFNSTGGKTMSFERVRDIELWKHRAIVLPVVHKVMNRVKAEQLKVPVRHIFAMVAGADMLTSDLSPKMAQDLREKLGRFLIRDGEFKGKTVTYHQDMALRLLDGVPVTRILETALNFGMHKGEESETLNNIMYTHWLDEHGANATFPGDLPNVKLSFGYYGAPLRTQAELTEIARSIRTLTVFDGLDAIIGRTHFMALKHKGGRIRALVKMQEPERHGDAWEYNIESTPGSGANANQYDELVDEYLKSDEFKAAYDPEQVDKARESLRAKVSRKAPEQDLTRLHNVYNADEIGTYLDQHHRDILTSKPWDLDEHGCISTPELDAMVDQLITLIKPYYGGGSGAKVLAA
jgi:hypothetical protein